MSCLHLHILGSGSKGNCALIEGPQGLIMVDDGLSRRETLKRMAELGLSADNVSALLITHEHSDHIKGLDVWCKHWHGPLFASRGTLSSKENLSHLPVEEFDPGDTLSIAGIHVQTYSTSHDVINPVGYRFDTLDDSIGFATDTGELSSKAMNTLEDWSSPRTRKQPRCDHAARGRISPLSSGAHPVCKGTPLQWPSRRSRARTCYRTHRTAHCHAYQPR